MGVTPNWNSINDRAIGTDTGGSVRLPAAYCGIVGFKPTYGLISRYGIVSYAHSLDTVGIFSRDVTSAQQLFSILPLSSINIDILNKHDKHDPTCIHPSIRSRFPLKSPQKWTFGVSTEYNLPSLHPAMSHAWASAIFRLQTSGHTVLKVSLPRTKEALSAYYVLATAEAASNLARYDGVRYGYNSPSEGYREVVLSSRAEGFGDEVRRRILLGNYTLSAK
jgi:aspartyl-tRNA(Asn)/glutamyl-tRNA(Gln) amidotransferase subunit A